MDIFAQVSKMPLPPTVEQSITQRLREDILTLQLAPGQQLGIAEIAERFGASYTPVRGALARLETEGFVHSVPHRGSVVAPLTANHADLVITVTGALERRIAQIGVPHLTAEDVATLDRIIAERERALVVRAPIEEMVASADQVRRIIAAQTANEPMVRQYWAWGSHRRRYLRYFRDVTPARPYFLSEHMTEFARHCRNRHADLAVAVLLDLDAHLTRALCEGLAGTSDPAPRGAARSRKA